MNEHDKLYKEGHDCLCSNPTKAKEIGQQILNMGYQDAHNLIATACFHIGEYELAAQHYLYHFSLVEDNPDIFVAIAACYARLKRYPLAFRYLSEGCEYGSAGAAYVTFHMYRLGRCNPFKRIFNLLKYGWKSRKLNSNQKKTYKNVIHENWTD